MADVIIPNGIRAELIYTFQSQRVQNVYHFTKGAPATTGDLSALFNMLKSWENLTARHTRQGSVQLTQIDLTALDGPGAPVLVSPVLPVIGGALGTNPLPAFVTLAVRHTSGLSGRSYRGRTYHIGIPQGWTASDNISQANADLVAGIYNQLRTQALSAGFTFCIASRYSGVIYVNGRKRAVPRAVGLLTPVAVSLAERYLDTNRHRKLPFQA